jgi:amidohydrolase
VPIDRSLLDQRLAELDADLRELALRIHAQPELGNQEVRAQAWIAELVAARGSVPVQRGTGDLPTALRSCIGTGHPPRVAVLAEYDALPELGHACGHNLIAAAAVGAFLGLAGQASELAGTVELVGTPAEEGGAGKIRMLRAGVFSGLDAAMMIHPFDRDLLAHPALACRTVVFRFRGVPAHAAASPWDGHSALTACLDTLRLVDSQRIHLRDGVRVHALVTDGGRAVNVIPDHAACEFCVRAPTETELARTVGVVERCGRGAAIASAVEVQVEVVPGYRSMRNNLALARRFGQHLVAMGRSPVEQDPSLGAASTDMGDVSHALAAIHPYLGICDRGAARWHEPEFAEHSRSDRALATMLVGARAMAHTLADLLEDETLLREVRGEFARDAEPA